MTPVTYHPTHDRTLPPPNQGNEISLVSCYWSSCFLFLFVTYTSNWLYVEFVVFCICMHVAMVGKYFPKIFDSFSLPTPRGSLGYEVLAFQGSFFLCSLSLAWKEGISQLELVAFQSQRNNLTIANRAPPQLSHSL